MGWRPASEDSAMLSSSVAVLYFEAVATSSTLRKRLLVASCMHIPMERV